MELVRHLVLVRLENRFILIQPIKTCGFVRFLGLGGSRLVQQILVYSFLSQHTVLIHVELWLVDQIVYFGMLMTS